MLTNGRTGGRINGKADACVAKSGGQGDVSCRILTLTEMSNFNINVDRWTNEQTDKWKIRCLYHKVRRSGRFFMQDLVVV